MGLNDNRVRIDCANRYLRLPGLFISLFCVEGVTSDQSTFSKSESMAILIRGVT